MNDYSNYNDDTPFADYPVPQEEVIVSTKKTSRTTKKTAPKKKEHIGVVYNAPVTLTFSLLCVGAMLLNQRIQNGMLALFVAPGSQNSAFAFNWKAPIDYARLFLHVLGHTSWTHLVSNLSFLLLLGPILEERFGAKLLVVMMVTVAFVTGVVNACFIPYGLTGSSGIVFMMILLSSYTTIDRTKIPLTFILVCLLFIGKEIMSLDSASEAGVSAVAHIVGGICGSVFGFMAIPRKKGRK